MHGLALVAFVCAFAAAQWTVALAAGAAGGLYPAGLLLLVLLAVGAFVGSLRERRQAAQRFYLVLSMVPILAIARLAFSDTPIPLLDPLLVYLLLAVAMLSLRQSAGADVPGPRWSPRSFLRALPFGLAVAAGLAILALVLPIPASAVPEGPPWLPVLVLGPVALLDEFWFRGLLQGEAARLTSAPVAWIAVAVMFAAYGVPFGTPAALLFRAGYGVLLGALAMRRDNLPITLVARIGFVLAVLAVNAGLAGTALFV